MGPKEFAQFRPFFLLSFIANQSLSSCPGKLEKYSIQVWEWSGVGESVVGTGMRPWLAPFHDEATVGAELLERSHIDSSELSWNTVGGKIQQALTHSRQGNQPFLKVGQVAQLRGHDGRRS